MRHTKNRQGSTVWVHEVKVDETVTFRTGRRGDRLVAEWPGLATLVCSRDGTGVRFAAAPGAPPRLVGKLRRGQVTALLRDLRGELALHASAVVIDGRAVLFTGPSGAGKSTAAAQMCLEHGAQLLADDMVSLDVSGGSVWALPSEEDHWLTDESCLVLGISRRGGPGDPVKCDFRATSIAYGPCRTSLVVALRFEPCQEAAVLPLRGGDAARSALDAVFRFDVDDAAARRREFEQVATLYRHVPFVELVRRPVAPSDVATLVLQAMEGRMS